MTRPILAADLFCGAGGTSTGLARACERAGRKHVLVAVNHWPVAIETHSRNHPGAQHHCARLEDADPCRLVPGGKLDILVASPTCTHHSRARGGRPTGDQMRADPWLIMEWLTKLRVARVLVENVPEMLEWGPVDPVAGKPIKSRRGEYFRAWVKTLRGIGYKVDWKVLTCADYGDATTRQRLFVQARCDGKPIRWPMPTHAPLGEITLFPLQPWRPAADIIDWSLPAASIFDRICPTTGRQLKPLAAKTLARIAAGIARWGASAEPFLVVLRRHCAARGIDLPIPTVTAGAEHLAIVRPVIVSGTWRGRDASVDNPLPTVTTRDGDQMVATPIIVPNFGEREGQDPRFHGIGNPLPTITSHGAGAVVTPMVLGQHSGAVLRPVSEPVPTIATGGAIRVLMPYYGNATAMSPHDPLGTITTLPRWSLVEGERLDITLRMLQPHELAAAHSMDDYVWTGNKRDVVKQIGNGVPAATAEALLMTALDLDRPQPAGRMSEERATA